MAQLTQEEIRDNLLSLFEEHEQELVSCTSLIEKVENDAVELFDKRIIAIKNRLIEDSSIADDDLQKVYLEEVEEARESTLKDVEEKIKALVTNNNG